MHVVREHSRRFSNKCRKKSKIMDAMRTVGKNAKFHEIWVYAWESFASPEKSPKSWKKNGKSPMAKVKKWKRSENGKSPIKKVRNLEKVLKWKKSEIRKKSEKGACNTSNFPKFCAEFGSHIFGPFRGPDRKKSDWIKIGNTNFGLDQNRWHQFRSTKYSFWVHYQNVYYKEVFAKKNSKF